MSGYPLRKGELVQSQTSEGWTVYEPESDSLHVLNDSARAIWELCDGTTSSEEMAEAISSLTGISVRQASVDVETALADLSSIGLVTMDT